MSVTMRAKMHVETVTRFSGFEVLKFKAVYKKEPYGPNGEDEDNTFALYTPQAELEMTINNPALLQKFEPGDTFYVDFTKA